MNNASAYTIRCNTCHSCSPPSLTVKSKDSTISAITIGYVAGVFKIDDNQNAVIVKISKDLFIAYTNLTKALVSKDQKIEKGTIIGNASLNIDHNLFEIEIFLATPEGNYLNEKNILELVQEANNISIAAVCDATVLN
ncbi:MAG TPA: hypothetical protein VFW07_14940 [Parafilimonas sp.]|nr:hypothetical protein [Parafilimonas sp.]